TPDEDLAGQSKAGLYGDWIHELDRSVGRILDTLDALGATESTLVIFTSDNGGVFKPEREMLQTDAYRAGLRVNGELRGGKHDVWEGGFKVPFIVRWPGQAAAASVCDEMISLADILATTAAIVGEPLPEASQAAEDSRSFLPALLGDQSAAPRTDLIVHSAPGVFAIRKGSWKWIEGVPAGNIKPAVRRTQGDQLRPQLYNIQNDPAEAQDLSEEHPEVAVELQMLLHRYRDGGYSRELPPSDVQPKRTNVVSLPPLSGTIVLNEPLSSIPARPWVTSGGQWEVHDGGLWGQPDPARDQPAALRAPISLADGSIEYEINLGDADRTSLRVEWGDRQGSFRVVISRTAVELTRNPSRGEAKDAIEPLARKALQLDRDKWYPVRVTFHGSEATVQVNDVVMSGAHAVLSEPKTGANLLVFGRSAGFRNLKVVTGK
ncbi:MAG: sulfatase-like hydrolase/transferase, partial [Planctomycetaceae bacterium]|nr:sulfatase-like hydrolase/transferase [Planctomycetaceae bacterium]